MLPDGTYLTVLHDARIRGRKRDAILAAARAGESLEEFLDPDGRVPQIARVIEYDVPDRDGTGELITLLTTILDPVDATAEELAAVYHQRWEHEMSEPLCSRSRVLAA